MANVLARDPGGGLTKVFDLWEQKNARLTCVSR
jgi:hypothetical protein